MAPRALRRSARKNFRAAVFGISCVAVAYTCGRAFTVKGAWDGQLSDASGLPKGLGPSSIGGIAVVEETGSGKASIAVEDGRLVVTYAEGPVSLSVDDGTAWQANYSKEDTTVHVRGRGWESIDWDIAKRADVDGLGTVDVNMNSDQTFGIAVVPKISQIQGADIRAVATSHGEDVKVRLESQRSLAPGVNFSYSVENEEGNYNVGELTHTATVDAKLDKFSAALLRLEGSNASKTYNFTLSRDLSGLFKEKSDAVVGVDNDGVYGALTGTRSLPNGLITSYQASGRGFAKDAEPTLAYSGSLAHDLGKVTVSRSSGEPLKAVLESTVTSGPLSATGTVSQTLAKAAGKPSFNVTLTRDMADVLPGGAEILLGVDSPSVDGVYGKVSAKMEAGGNANLEYSSIGRVKDMEHSLKVSNDLGYARLVKAGDTAPRLQLGYQFDA